MMGRTSRSTADSSPLSFYTSKEEPDETGKSTAATTPLHGQECSYRNALQLPRELKQHCQIFLEEQLYICAINLLSSILASRVSTRISTTKPVSIPPPSHLAILNTIAIHPLHTTRVEKPEQREVSSLALSYLRNLLAVVGPLNAGFRAAFQFRAPSRSRRTIYHEPYSDDGDMMADGGGGTDSEEDGDQLRGKMANQSSIWSRGQDFWSVVGWAFNCSDAMPHRWSYWKAWLEFMLDVLEADWTERGRVDEEAHVAEGKVGRVPTTSRSESLIIMYMNQKDGRHSGVKAIIKALTADGHSVSSASFQEVFEKEYKQGNRKSNKRKREEVLDLANDKFADYFEDEAMSSGISEPPTPQKRKTTATHDGPADLASSGLAESVPLRLRLFTLISAALHNLGKQSELGQVYQAFAASIKVMPLELFSLIISQRENPLILAAHITLTKELFLLLLPSSAKDPRKVDPEHEAQGMLTMSMLEHCYVGHPANTVSLEDNAKLSLVVESAVQQLLQCNSLEYTEEFAEAVERGVQARIKKSQRKRTGRIKTETAGDVLASTILTNSSERIGILLELIKASPQMEQDNGDEDA